MCIRDRSPRAPSRRPSSSVVSSMRGAAPTVGTGPPRPASSARATASRSRGLRSRRPAGQPIAKASRRNSTRTSADRNRLFWRSHRGESSAIGGLGARVPPHVSNRVESRITRISSRQRTKLAAGLPDHSGRRTHRSRRRSCRTSALAGRWGALLAHSAGHASHDGISVLPEWLSPFVPIRLLRVQAAPRLLSLPKSVQAIFPRRGQSRRRVSPAVLSGVPWTGGRHGTGVSSPGAKPGQRVETTRGARPHPHAPFVLWRAQATQNGLRLP